MQCLEVHRLLTSDPDSREAALHEHLAGCRSCRMFSQRMTEFNADLQRAVEVDIPEGLSARILLNQSTTEIRQSRYWRSSWLAMAASLLLVVGVTFSLLTSPSLTPLQQDVLAHVYDELPHLSEQNHVSQQQLEQLLSHYGAALDGPIGQVNYAGACPISRSVGVHLVMEAKGKPVTVLVMPEESISAKHTLRDARFQGVIVPVGEQGSMAIIGEDDDSVHEIEVRVRKAVKLLS